MSKFLWAILILIASILFLISAFTKSILIAMSALALSLLLEMTRRKREPKKNKKQSKTFHEDIKKERKN